MNNNPVREFSHQVKDNYYLLYICSLLSFDEKKLKKIFLLINIFVEINMIQNKITDKMIGFIRLAWWRENLQELKHDHPLLSNFKLWSEDWQLELFFELIDLCENEIEDGLSQDTELKKYSILLKLILDNDPISNVLAEKLFMIDQVTKKNIKYLESELTINFAKNDKLFVSLFITGIKFYIDKIRKNNSNESHINHEKYKLSLLINIYIKFLLFKFS